MLNQDFKKLILKWLGGIDQALIALGAKLHQLLPGSQLSPLPPHSYEMAPPMHLQSINYPFFKLQTES